MLHKIICLVCVVNSLVSFSNLFILMKSQITELRVEQKHHNKFIEELFKEMDHQMLKAEQKRQGKLIEDLLKAMDIQNRQEKFIDGLEAKLEEQEKYGANKESKIKFLTQELERQEKLMSEFNEQLNNQSLQADQEEHGELIEDLVKESDKDNLQSHAVNCTDAKSSGIHEILIPNFSSQSFPVACDADTQEGGWTIILRRIDGSEDFDRNWAAYKEGFGNLNGEYFLGLNKIHALTAERRQQLLVVLEDFEGIKAYETYDEFEIDNERENYRYRKLGKANGTAGDAIRNAEPLIYFAIYKTYYKITKDDEQKDKICGDGSFGSWLFPGCYYSNLAGKYNETIRGKGLLWTTFRGEEYSLKRAVMMIRPKK